MAAPSDTTAPTLRGESPSVLAESPDRSIDGDAAKERTLALAQDRTLMEQFLRNLLLALSTWPT